jgi:argininosuccinate synthase
MVSFEKAGGYRQSDATGFIRLNALRLRIKAQLEAERKAAGGGGKKP